MAASVYSSRQMLERWGAAVQTLSSRRSRFPVVLYLGKNSGPRPRSEPDTPGIVSLTLIH